MSDSPLCILIPARFASTRLPGKPLALIQGIPMIVRVLEQLNPLKNQATIAVATDHPDIAHVVEQYGHQVVMTNENHPSGTDRLAEAAQILGIKHGRIINVQGDEPFVDPEQILQLSQLLLSEETEIATLVSPIENETDFQNPNIVKAVFDHTQKALYFSRLPIPYFRTQAAPNTILGYKHHGLYGYQAQVLQEIAQLPPGKLEVAESLEQLRWLEAGYTIRVALTNHSAPAVDTIEDLTYVNNIWKNQ